MAYVTLEHAMKNLGQRVRIIDHHNFRAYDSYLVQTIMNMCPDDLTIKYNQLHGTIEVNKR